MAGHLTTGTKLQIYNALYKNLPFSVQPNLEVALSLQDPGEDGSNFLEPTGASYARVSVTTSDWSTPDPTDATGVNTTSIIFPTALEEWGLILYAGLYDPTPVPNDLISFYSLAEAAYISTGITIEFAVGDFRFGPWLLP